MRHQLEAIEGLALADEVTLHLPIDDSRAAQVLHHLGQIANRDLGQGDKNSLPCDRREKAHDV